MAEIIKKIANAGKIYSIGGGSTPVEEVEHKVVTQEEFDVIPQEEKVKNVYMIKGEAEPTPTPGGGTAIERGDMLLTTVYGFSDSDMYFIGPNYSSGNFKIKNKNGVSLIERSNGRKLYISGGYLYYVQNVSYELKKLNLDTLEEISLEGSGYIDSVKYADYIYINYYKGYTPNKYIKIDYEGNEFESSEGEYNSIPEGYYKGLYYSQDGNDYVAKTKEGTEVKRYSGVGTVDAIYNDKLYRNIGDVSYAIASIPTT